MTKEDIIDSGFEIIGKILSYAQANPNDAKVCVCLHGPKDTYGMRLTTKAISEMTDISRTTVNDVLNRLIEKNLVKKEELSRYRTYTLTSGGLAVAKGYINFVKELAEFAGQKGLPREEKEKMICVAKRW
jgi:DNA-binding MarR family transcriptional regulator